MSDGSGRGRRRAGRRCPARAGPRPGNGVAHVHGSVGGVGDAGPFGAGRGW